MVEGIHIYKEQDARLAEIEARAAQN